MMTFSSYLSLVEADVKKAGMPQIVADDLPLIHMCYESKIGTARCRLGLSASLLDLDEGIESDLL